MNKNKIKKNFSNGVFQLANSLYNEALVSFSECIFLGLKAPEVYCNRGIAFNGLGQYTNAINDYRKAIRLNPNYAEAFSNLGVSFNHLERYKDASIALKKAIYLQPSFATAYINLGISLYNLSMVNEALKQYDTALALNPNSEITYMQRGIAFTALKKYNDAFDSFDRAITLNPNYVDAYLNAGIAFMAVKNPKEALAIYNQAILIDPNIARLHKLKSNSLYELKQYEESIESLTEALKIDANLDQTLGDLLLRKNYICDWADYGKLSNKIKEKIEKNLMIAQSFACISVLDDPVVLKKAAILEVSELSKKYSQINILKKYTRHEKIRLGFYSSDFKTHPIAQLTSEFFERIDRSKFEIIAFSFINASDSDSYKARLIKTFDRFINVDGVISADVVRMSRELEIDIAFDLNGFTADCRTDIFALRVAPIQIQWLGFLGTMGAEFIDYIFADNVLIPQEERKHYTEKIVYLPYYQPNDTKREISFKQLTRSDFGLPNNQFVFCCFNNTYKISPYIFDSWMQILKRSPKSVLWIVEEGETAKLNIKKETLARGVEPSRIIFASKIPLPEYLARFKLADLFLDTYPYSAGTVASDALRMGLPLIALQGRTFSSRMSSSILHSMNMPELITKSPAQYEDLAIDIYNDNDKHDEIKRKIQAELPKSPLFDIERTTKSIEMALEIIYDRSQSNKPIEHIFLDS